MCRLASDVQEAWERWITEGVNKIDPERLIADLTWALSRHENAVLFGTLESPHEIAETLVADIVQARLAAAYDAEGEGE